jgi:hypothetical protein
VSLSGNSNPNRHQPLIDALAGFYRVLAEICYVQYSDMGRERFRHYEGRICLLTGDWEDISRECVGHECVG